MSSDSTLLVDGVNTWKTREGVRASAGSGKTYALTSHFLRAFLSGASPESILATTFTRKAAGEILGRVLERLGEACREDAHLQRLKSDIQMPELDRDTVLKQLQRLTRALHQVSISTIDSFFAKLLYSFQYESGLPSNVRTVEPGAPEMVRIRREAIRRVLAHDDRNEMLRLLDSLLRGMTSRAVAFTLDEKLNEAHEIFQTTPASAWESHRKPGVLLPQDEIAATLKLLQEEATAMGESQLGHAMEKDIAKAASGSWGDFLEAGLPKALGDKGTYNRKPIPPQIAEAYQPLAEHAQSILLSQHAAYTLALRDLLKIYDEAYRDGCRQERVLLFSDVPLALARLLPEQDATEIAHRTNTAINHLLLDEFQDTDPEQYAILKPFADAIDQLSHDQGLIFCVGDLKQSIYGWRGATPEIFEQFGEDHPAVEWSNNDVSYRSSQIILDAVNELFGGLAGNDILQGKAPSVAQRWQEHYRPHTARRQLTGYVEVLESLPEETYADGESEDGAADGEGGRSTDPHLDFVARQIQRIAEEAPQASIGVLMRGNVAAAHLLFLLKRLGVAAGTEGGTPLVDDPAVGIILSALTFADHPGDTAALFHVLNSPLAGALGLLEEPRPPAAESALRIRQQLVALGYGATLSQWVRVLSPHCDERGAQRLLQLLELTDSFKGRGGTRPMDFVNFARTQAVENAAQTRIRVMTIHKSKGLEFDIVVLPELHRKLLMPSAMIYRRDRKTLRINEVTAYPNKLLRSLDPRLEEMYREYTELELREALCLLYVAMTRARRALHIIIPAPGYTNSGALKKPGFSLASILRAGLSPADDPDPSSILYQRGDAQWHNAVLTPAAELPDLAAKAELPALDITGLPGRTWKSVTPSSQGHSNAKSAAELLGLNEQDGRLRGRVIHALFSRLEWGALPPESELLQVALQESGRLELAQTYLSEFHSMMTALADNGALARPAGTDAEDLELWLERSFTIVLDGALVTGQFDRVVIISLNGVPMRAELLDYKTDAIPTAAAPTTAELYRPQIEIYARSLGQMLNLPLQSISAQLLFLGIEDGPPVLFPVTVA